MADITMCSSEGCPLEKECYRKLAKRSKYQTFGNLIEICNKDNNYKMLWRV